ncbi:hypothetical protein B0T40_18715 [Chromobacterium haemolyticum]|nr:hypothetical protein B0T40_18715 [Chromobacterium haemolyticum]
MIGAQVKGRAGARMPAGRPYDEIMLCRLRFLLIAPMSFFRLPGLVWFFCAGAQSLGQERD